MFSGLRPRWGMVTLMLAVLVGLALPTAARADDTLGGHFGFVLPLVTRAGGETTTLGDRFTIGFPIGITVKKNSKVAFDLEFVPTIKRAPLDVSLTVHPGIVYALSNNFAAGLRMAFDVDRASWGFTPLLNRKLADLGGGSSLFGELVVPIRFQEEHNSISVGVHMGIGF